MSHPTDPQPDPHATPTPPVPPAPRLEMRDVAKTFGSTCALDGVSLDVRPGEVHALVGENGAGKTTLMKILAGAIRPDAGRMRLDGRPFHPRHPLQARDAGVAMIYQELSLAPHLTVEQNVMLGIEPTRLGFVRRRWVRRQALDALDMLRRPDIRPDVPVDRLAPAARQLVEVARALATRARVVVMDEPTSSLSHADTDALFAVIRRLRHAGVSVVYISHFLEEVRAVADRFTVLRDGRVAGAGNVAQTPTADIIRLMVGRDLADMYHRTPHAVGAPVLDLAALAGRARPRHADLVLHRGEILGIAGLVASGRTELVRAVFGLDPVAAGRVRVHHLDTTGMPPAAMLARGVGFLSEDRKNEGLAAGLTVADNLTLSRLRPYRRFGLLRRARARRAASRWIDRLAIRTRGPDQPVADLSGGNQQKVALARLLHQQADVLLLDEPTRGIDVASKADVYALLGQLAAQGKAVLWISSYLPELLGVCDSLAVMHRGRLSDVRPAHQWTPETVMAVATAGAADAKGDAP